MTRQRSVYVAVKSTKKDFESALKNVSALEDVEYDENRKRGEIGAHLYFKSSADPVSKLNDVIREQNWNILEFHPEKLSLEDSFIRLTQSSDSNDQKAEKTDEEGGAE